jgi:glyoxylate reductase
MKVFVSQPLPEPSTTQLLAGFEVTIGRGGLPDDEVEAHLRDADAFLPTPREKVAASVLSLAPKLRIVATCSVGTDHVDLEACRSRGIIVTNTPDVLTQATADLTWALILAVARRLREGEALARSGTWDGWKPLELLGMSLDGKMLGIWGGGRIGRAVARRGEAFGMRALLMRSTDDERRFQRLLEESDVLSLHVPLTSSTKRRFGRTEFGRMKKGALFVNTARGALVDESALFEALSSGHLGGAGLDVYENEPLVHPGLLGLSNVVLLPHLGSATRETRLAMARMACEEIARCFRGEPPLHRVV